MIESSDRMVRAEPAPGLPPIADPRARVLVLGSFPGVASLQASAYYAHPRNQFWPILGALVERPLADLPYAERLDAVRARGIAIWDVVGHCVRTGSLDSAIREALDNDFEPLLAALPDLVAVAFNGGRAARAARYFSDRGYAVHTLPSTSPAHASRTFADKLAAWRVLEPRLLGPSSGPSPGPSSGPSSSPSLSPSPRPPAPG